ncbi:MAG TPA: substrate-binding domain-containing protein, partial [Polyangiaceae bacterium]
MYRSRTKFGTKAQTIGVLVDCPGGPYQTAVLAGIAETARKLEANILCFALGVQRERAEAVVGRRFAQQLVGPHNLDGAILFSTTLTDETGAPGLLRLARSYNGLRLCSLGVPLEGIPSVTVDNRAGIRQVVAHLVRDHRLQRIAFICGPEGNVEADERLEAYRSELTNQAIPFDSKLTIPGNFLEEAGRAAVRTLAQRSAGLESIGAIVSCNDQMAIGALSELEKMNIRVPEKIAVVGFDDIEESRFSQPALATVRQPLSKIGGEAVRCVAAIGGRDEPAASVELKAELVARRSCGCAGEFKSARASTPAASMASFDSGLLQHRQRIVNKLARAAGGLFGAA